MLVTRKWIEENKTVKGGYTREQLQCLGLPWPGPKGWPKSVRNTTISDEAARRFEALGRNGRAPAAQSPAPPATPATRKTAAPASVTAQLWRPAMGPANAQEGSAARETPDGVWVGSQDAIARCKQGYELPLNHYRSGRYVAHAEREHDSWRALIPGAFVAWTDGSCLKNPGGPGGWGVALYSPDGALSEHYGPEPDTTNNRAELLAVIHAVELTPADVPLVVCTDSQWALKGAVGRWKRAANTDLWARLDSVCAGRFVVFEWHKGHADIPGNELADRLADRGAQEAAKLMRATVQRADGVDHVAA